MFIEILKYGDFDTEYTDCIMFSESDYNIKDLLTEFAAAYSFTPNDKVEPKILAKLKNKKKWGILFSNDGKLKISNSGISNIQIDEANDAPDLFVAFLNKKNFKKLSMKSVSFSD